MLPELVPEALDLGAAAPSLLVLIGCTKHSWGPPQPWCASEVLAQRAAVGIATRYTGRLNVSYAAPTALPLASMGLSAHTDLPALLLISSRVAGGPHLLAANPRHTPPNSERAWAARIDSLIAGDASTPIVRSAPPPPPPAAWMPLAPLVSTAASLEADLAALGHCSLLLVHDARLDALTDPTAALPARWRALALHLADRLGSPSHATPATDNAWRAAGDVPTTRLLQLDMARNDLPATALGAALSAAVASTGLPCNATRSYTVTSPT